MATFGLVLDMIGVVLLGWIVPRGTILVALKEGGGAKPSTWWSKAAHHLGWGCLLVGFALQIGG